MSRLEDIQHLLRELPPEMQLKVLDFVSSLQRQLAPAQHATRAHSLREDPAFGSWTPHKVDALEYQQALRSEWESGE